MPTAYLPERSGLDSAEVDYEEPCSDQFNWGFGGIRERYRRHPGRVLRLVDPFLDRPVHFATPLQFENWLLRRFDPGLHDVSAEPLEWSAVHRGTLVKLRPHLCWRSRQDGGHLELVVEPGQEPVPRRLEVLELVARAHGLRPSVRTAKQVRAHPKLLSVLERVRQVLTLSRQELREGQTVLAVDQAVAALRSTTRGGLKRVLRDLAADLSDQQLDAALFWSRHLRRCHFDISLGEYGDDTAIQAI